MDNKLIVQEDFIFMAIATLLFWNAAIQLGDPPCLPY